MYNVDGPNIYPSEIVTAAPSEGQILVSFTSEPNWEALAFPEDYSTRRNHFNEERVKCDDRIAANPQYIFHALDWIERNAFVSSVHFAE